MGGRRWAFTAVAVLAALLIIGRVVAGWYVDYLWFSSLGAAAVWRARAMDLLLLRGSAFAVSASFVFVNLFAVRHSVVSLVLPRRMDVVPDLVAAGLPTVALKGVTDASLSSRSAPPFHRR